MADKINAPQTINVSGVNIQKNMIKNIKQEKEKTIVKFNNGAEISYTANKGKATIKRCGKQITISDLKNASIHGTNSRDEFYIVDSENLKIHTKSGKDSIQIFDSNNINIDSGADDDWISVGQSTNLKITTNQGDDHVGLYNVENAVVESSGTVETGKANKIFVLGNKNTKVTGNAIQDGNGKFEPNLQNSIIDNVESKNVQIFYSKDVSM